ncbi:MAG: hypothetical protein Ct9H300mP25_16930 [Acidobacteriota bacterium]|nr:MAG: hypothetical protein Ct9H300mP25_16930 [Acidobacteriota bacterium]
MALLATLDPDRLGGSGEPGFASYIMLIIAGCSGGAAMILPGLSVPISYLFWVSTALSLRLLLCRGRCPYRHVGARV